MRKLMLLAAVLAMVIVAAVPAIAQIGQESEQEAESGDVDQSFTVTGGGDNSNQCVGIQGVANTGNAQNQLDFIQYASTADDFEFDEVGSTITVSPENSTSCEQAVQQAAAASSGFKY
jgi:maltose-binding protein MalE